MKSSRPSLRLLPLNIPIVMRHPSYLQYIGRSKNRAWMLVSTGYFFPVFQGRVLARCLPWARGKSTNVKPHWHLRIGPGRCQLLTRSHSYTANNIKACRAVNYLGNYGLVILNMYMLIAQSFISSYFCDYPRENPRDRRVKALATSAFRREVGNDLEGSPIVIDWEEIRRIRTVSNWRNIAQLQRPCLAYTCDPAHTELS